MFTERSPEGEVLNLWEGRIDTDSDEEAPPGSTVDGVKWVRENAAGTKNMPSQTIVYRKSFQASKSAPASVTSKPFAQSYYQHRVQGLYELCSLVD